MMPIQSINNQLTRYLCIALRFDRSKGATLDILPGADGLFRMIENGNSLVLTYLAGCPVFRDHLIFQGLCCTNREKDEAPLSPDGLIPQVP